MLLIRETFPWFDFIQYRRHALCFYKSPWTFSSYE